MPSSTSQFLSLRGLNSHIRHWGHPDGRPLLLLHGWMDNAASWQFLADALGPGWHLIAPDWRGFGLSEWSTSGVYAYTDYLADLDALVDKLTLPPRVDILGHGLGGYIGCMYAATRPERVRSLVNLEGMGLRAREGQQAPAYLRTWLEEIRRPRMPKTYASYDDLARRILQNNPWLDEGRADFVARHWATETIPGVVTLTSDPGHNNALPDLFRLDEAKALWGAIECPVLWIEAAESRNTERHHISEEELRERRGSIRHLQTATIPRAGHLAHLEQPEALARLVQQFLDAPTPAGPAK
jgi:pimeloyl-ACP methyl ester carboxylesterase